LRVEWVLILASCGPSRSVVRLACPPDTTLEIAPGEERCVDADGRRQGPGRLLADDGWTRAEGDYRDDEPVGVWRRFDAQGHRLADVERGRAALVALPAMPAHPDPAVASALWIGAPVEAAAPRGPFYVARTADALYGVDAGPPAAARWRIASPTPLIGAGDVGPTVFGALAADGSFLLVPEPRSDRPDWYRFALGARPTPAPAADDVGVLYVDALGALHDLPFAEVTHVTPDRVEPSVLAVAGSRAAAAQGDALHVWERATGVVAYTVEAGAPIRAATVPDWRLAFIATDAEVIAFSFGSGEIRWRAPHAAGAPGSVVRVGDHVTVRGSTGVAWFAAADGAAADAPVDVPTLRAESGALLLPFRAVEPSTASSEVRPLKMRVEGASAADVTLSAWSSAPFGAERLGVGLPPAAIGQMITLELVFSGLPDDVDPNPLVWGDGWHATVEPAWAARCGDAVVLATGDRPPDLDDAAARYEVLTPRGLPGVRVERVGRRFELHAAPDAPLCTLDVRRPGWLATRRTVATWVGVPVAPWSRVYSRGPSGWTGWSP
jgi:hypothetical protein